MYTSKKVFIIKNALLYVKNHRDVPSETINQHLSQQPGISRVAHSRRSNGLIFIDYQPSATSITDISHGLERQGMTNCIVGM